jgi:hypothetical protein
MFRVTRPEISLPVAPLTGAMDSTIVPASEERLSIVIVRLIERRTGNKVQDLHVLVKGDQISLHGRCASFYTKQLAQHAAMSVAMGATLHNEILVV